MANTNKPNRLIKSTSPYLKQHAFNPVDWFEWGSEAFQKALAEDKPILLSIGYSSCHWCHVMAHQSFEDNDIAQLMNEHFVCIKLDREERPDVDQIYMEAVQAMQQNGGWPLNVFLTPQQKPFFGGTYFPPKNWAQLLLQINKAFKEKRKEIEVSANDLSSHLSLSDLDRFRNQPTNQTISKEMLDNMFGILESRIDFTNGGLDKAPKFIMPSIWLFLARYYDLSKNDQALEILQLTLNKIAAGGIYDQIRGGFARYSVDGEWFAPHFEKMLYDNGQLLSLYSEAFQLTKNETYKNIVYETVSWLTAEMTSPEGGFYSALDADSEGEEGKFYTWTYPELKEVLQNSTEDVVHYYGATHEGNWEQGRNILKRTSEDSLHPESNKFNELLLEARNKKIKPGLDDKILTGWNAITIQGLTDAYRAFGDTHFLELAEKAIACIEANLIVNDKLFRSFNIERSAVTGFLDDYAFLIQAYISLYQVTFNERYIREASRWCTLSITQFLDSEEGFFYYNSSLAESLIARKKEIFDNVIPSSNSVMARNLYQLSIVLDKPEWQELSLNMISRLTHLIQSEPVYMCHWALLASEVANGLTEVAIVGKNSDALRMELQKKYLPFTFVTGTHDKSTMPLLSDKEVGNQTMLFVCKNKTCKLPVHTVNEALQQMTVNQ
jgi:hypothetical protein